MDDLDPTLVVLVGAVLPLALAVIMQPTWPDNVRSLVAFLVIMAVGVGVAWLSDNMDRDGILATCGAIWVMAQASYTHLWKQNGVTKAIEESTSRKPTPGG